MKKMTMKLPWYESVARICDKNAKIGYDPTLMTVENLKHKEKYF